MAVLDQVLGELSGIADDLLADAVLNEGLLEQGVAAVFFIGQDAFDRTERPLRFSVHVEDVLGFQPVLDLTEAGSGDIAVVDLPDHLGLFRDDLRPAITAFLIGVPALVLITHLSLPHGLADAPDDVPGDGFALRLGESAQDGNEHLAVGFQGVDALLLEDHRDAQFPQGADIVEAVHRIPGEAGDGFGQHDVDLLLFALADHPQKLRALPGGRTCYALIREQSRHGPVRVGHDLVRVVGLLGLVTGELLLLVRADPAVGGDTLLALDGLFPCQLGVGGDDDNSGCCFCHDAWLLSMS